MMRQRFQNIILCCLVMFSIGVAASSWSGAAASSSVSQVRPTLAPSPTQGPTRPPLTPSSGSPRASKGALSHAANLCLRLLTEPNQAVAPGEVMIYQFVAKNIGVGAARDVMLTVPFAADTQQLLDATFTNPTAWVSAVRSGEIELRLPSLDPSEVVTATLRLLVNPTDIFGRALTSFATFNWSDKSGGGAGRSNVSTVIVTRARASATTNPLTIVPPSGSRSTTFTVSYNGLAANEHVSHWYHDPTGHVVALDEREADSAGRVVFELAGAMLPVGRTTLVAFGQCSQVTATGMLVVTNR